MHAACAPAQHLEEPILAEQEMNLSTCKASKRHGKTGVRTLTEEHTTKSFQTNLIRPAGVKYSGRYGGRPERKGGRTGPTFMLFCTILRERREEKKGSKTEGCSVHRFRGVKKRQRLDVPVGGAKDHYKDLFYSVPRDGKFK